MTHASVLERLDLVMASRMVEAHQPGEDPAAHAVRFQDRIYTSEADDAGWISALLQIRGLVVTEHDVREVLAGRSSRFESNQQELRLIRGMVDVLGILRDRGARGLCPDGWFMAEMFKTLTRGIPRFKGNVLRRDEPWDGLLHVQYPHPTQLQTMLDTFDAAHHYRDVAMRFESLHPVRQSTRVLWKFARLAPFPDFNTIMAYVAMNAYLLAHGYPIVVPDPKDRELLQRVVAGAPPLRVAAFERRLLNRVEQVWK